MCVYMCMLAVDGMLTSGDCDDVTMTYRCSNQRCIPRHLVNNSVNDCLDNSDEGNLVISPFPHIGVRSIVRTVSPGVSVCLSVCLSANISQERHV